MVRKSPRKAVGVAHPAAGTLATAWASPRAGGEFSDLFERVLAVVAASPDARRTLPAMRLVSKPWRDTVDEAVTVGVPEFLLPYGSPDQYGAAH